jgi:hypothetical protein
MPRHKNIVTVIREMVRDEVNAAVAGLLGATKTQAKTRRRRRRGGKWRPGGPGRPPLAAKAARARKKKKPKT